MIGAGVAFAIFPIDATLGGGIMEVVDPELENDGSAIMLEFTLGLYATDIFCAGTTGKTGFCCGAGVKIFLMEFKIPI